LADALKESARIAHRARAKQSVWQPARKSWPVDARALILPVRALR